VKVSFITVIGECMFLFLLILVVLLICPWLWPEKWNTEWQWLQLLYLPYQFRTYQTGLLW